MRTSGGHAFSTSVNVNYRHGKETGRQVGPYPSKNARVDDTSDLQPSRNVKACGEDPDVEFLNGTSFHSAGSRRIAWGTVPRGFVHNMICCYICGILLFGVANISEKGWSSYDTVEKPLYALSNPLLVEHMGGAPGSWYSCRKCNKAVSVVLRSHTTLLSAAYQRLLMKMRPLAL
jgi:hypothetical protein